VRACLTPDLAASNVNAIRDHCNAANSSCAEYCVAACLFLFPTDAFVGLTGSEREIRAAEQAAGVPLAPPDKKRGSNYAVQHSSLVIPYSPDNRATSSTRNGSTPTTTSTTCPCCSTTDRRRDAAFAATCVRRRSFNEPGRGFQRPLPRGSPTQRERIAPESSSAAGLRGQQRGRLTIGPTVMLKESEIAPDCRSAIHFTAHS
jgi:hypothetical protein